MIHRFSSIDALPTTLWRWPHITPAEWASRDGEILIDTDFLDLFERLRTVYGHPLPITSGYRSPAHNAAVSTTGENGPHTTGRAMDIHVVGAEALIVLRFALALGYTGIGVAQSSTSSARFLHLDTLTAPDYPRPMIWSY